SIMAQQTGQILVDDLQNPTVALVSHPLVCILMGDSETGTAEELLSHIPRHRSILVPNREWSSLLRRHWGIRLIPSTRTKFSSRSLDLHHIANLKENLPEEYAVQIINKEYALKIYETMREMREIIDFFGSVEEFLQNGFGYCITYNDEVVSVAATGTPILGNDFEVQVETVNSTDHRRKGLATVACAFLLEMALQRGLTPQWDAADARSAQFAEKMGFCDPVQYDTFLHTMLPIAILRKLKILKGLRILISFFKPNAFE
ncbi:MAG: GNAT family N-acetyltransferase, partial [Candidatus Thorarchaeota archaeon]